MHPEKVGDAFGLGVPAAAGGQQARHLQGRAGRVVERAEVAQVAQVDGGDQRLEARARRAPGAALAIVGQAPAGVDRQAEAGDLGPRDQALEPRQAGGDIDPPGVAGERHPADVAVEDFDAAGLGQRSQVPAARTAAFHRMHPGDDLRARVLGHGRVQHGREGVRSAAARRHRPVPRDLVDDDDQGRSAEQRIAGREIRGGVVLAEVGLAHQGDQLAGLPRLLGRERRAVLDQRLDLAGPKGVVVHALPVGGEAEVGVAPSTHSRGREEAVLEREIGQAAPAGLAHGRALDSPSGQSVDPLGRRHARRKEYESVTAAEELLQPGAAERHPDRAHPETQSAHVFVG